MPTDTAATPSVSGWAGMRLAATSRVQASWRATYAPEIDAVRVPPSAWMTSQSTVIWFSPRTGRSHTARRDRPMSRWISWVRPDTLPRAASRSVRSVVDPGSIEYSAVTQPRPLPRSQGGIRSSTEAVQITLVRPISTRTDPEAKSVKSRVKLRGRRSSGPRPSARVFMGSNPRTLMGGGQEDLPAESLRAFHDRGGRVESRPEMGEHQAAGAGCPGRLPRLAGGEVNPAAFVVALERGLGEDQVGTGPEHLGRPVRPGVGGVDEALAV